jgi:ferredoxin-NADP reductase
VTDAILVLNAGSSSLEFEVFLPGRKAATSKKGNHAMTSEAKRPVYSLGLRKRSEVAERTLEFRFDKPAGMTFKAGQYMDLTLIDPPETDAEGNSRYFAINSAPLDPELTFTTRLRVTAFKRVLRTMPLGTAVRVEGPFGNFTLHNNASRPAVLLAGGIGITPFRSIVRRAAQDRLPHRILLFYGNRRPEDAPFLDELGSLARENPNFTFIPTMTEMSGSHLQWKGETGRIDRELIVNYLKPKTPSGEELWGPIYYIAGPPAMVAGLRTMLNNADVDDDDIRTEEFAGY